MKELGYERRFREWAEARGISTERLRYARREAGGETVAYRFTPNRRPRAVVLIAHGAGNDALFSFPGFFKQLLTRGYEVFTFDLDGHGRTSTTRFLPDAIAGAIPAALEQARTGRAGLPVHAVGVSLGGSLLLQALASLGDAVSSAVLVAAPLQIRFSLRAVLGEIGIGLAATALRQREHLGLWGLVPSFGPVKRGSYPLRLAAPAAGSFGYVDVLNDTLERMRLEDTARRVWAPVLLVFGTADRLVPPEQGERLRDLIPGAALLKIPGGTHLTAFFADIASTRILAWLEEHTACVETA